MGGFSEFIRKLPNSKRSFHPFWSLSAIGPNASILTKEISKNAYDNNSVFSRLFNLPNSYFMSLGNHPRFMLSVIHHMELINNVPYRYNKIFEHSVMNNEKKLITDKFELYVLKEKFINKKRSENKKIFDNYEKHDVLEHANVLNSNIYIFNLNNFYNITQKLFEKDINCWWK